MMIQMPFGAGFGDGPSGMPLDMPTPHESGFGDMAIGGIANAGASLIGGVFGLIGQGQAAKAARQQQGADMMMALVAQRTAQQQAQANAQLAGLATTANLAANRDTLATSAAQRTQLYWLIGGLGLLAALVALVFVLRS